MDKTLEKAINDFAIAKLWNDLLDDEDQSDQDFADLDNYVSRMSHVVLGRSKQVDGPFDLDRLVNECNRIIKTNSEIDSYTNKEKETTKLRLTKKELKTNTSLVVLDTPERKAVKKQQSTTAIKCNKENETAPVSKPDVKTNNESEQSNHSMLDRFKKEINQKNNGNIKALLNELLSKDVDIINQVCLNLIDIENFDGHGKKVVSLKEDDLSLLLLNLNPTQVSYNSAQTYLRALVGEYFSIKFHCLSATEELFSRDIMNAFNYLLKEFTHQFISSCLIVWTLELAPQNQQQLLAPTVAKTLADYILKIVKEEFHEIEANLMLTGLTTTSNQSSHWPESIYSIVTSLIEKLACLNYQVLSSLLTRMQCDSNVLTKSSVFSKCLLLLINKCKSNVVSSQTTNVGLTDSLLNLIEIIIGNNQTLIKKSLQNAFKALRS